MQSLTVADEMAFDAKRRVRKRLIMTDKIESEMVCYEPGQGTVEHHHVVEDEIFYVVEGRGTMTVDGETVRIGPTSMVFAPAQSKHSLQCDDDCRMVVVFFKAPARTKRELPRKDAG